jgi:diguanylate cyclase (GGDEF)-like protein
MEARVVFGMSLLIGFSLVCVLVVTTNALTSRSLERAAEDLETARTAFYRLTASRAAFAATQSRLITALPIFRAHMTDVRLASDLATLDAMADEYRDRLNAQFCIVTDRNGRWIGSPGWSAVEQPPAAVLSGIEAALAGNPHHSIASIDNRLFLVVFEPARFAEEILGSLTAGYLLDDTVAQELAELTHSEVNLVAGTHLSGSSLPEAARAGLRALLATPAELQPTAGILPTTRAIGGVPYVTGAFSLFADRTSDQIGGVLLLRDWRPTQQFVDEVRRRFLFAGVLTFAFAVVGGVIFGRRMSQPFKDIAAAAGDIAAGNWARQVPIHGSAEATTMAVAFNEMSTGLRGAQERLVYDAFHDHLTQLPNRALFMDRLQRVITRASRRSGYIFAVLFIDLDRFKTVNDSLGHPAGDRLLLEVGRRLSRTLRHEDTVSRPVGTHRHDTDSTLARVGGDEFAIILEGLHDPSDAVRIAERIRDVVGAPVSLDGQEAFTSASIGIAVGGSAKCSGEDLVRDADIAMYRAKALGGDRCAVFNTAMHDRAVERLQLETDLRRAIERHEFTLRYQSIVSLSDYRIIGFEALLRWQHPEQGLLVPERFLDAAEETGLMARLDYWVLREACTQASRWRGWVPGSSPVDVSVNISAQGFGQPDFARHVARTLHETGLEPHNLRLEITERVAMADAERTRLMLIELKALGVRISLDDFGTGYSSLSYLQRFPVDTLKIDRGFVARLDQNDECREIIRTIVNLARTLRLDVIAEGIETATQVDYVHGLACGSGQGYFFSRPLPIDELRAVLTGAEHDPSTVSGIPTPLRPAAV